jgi:hypothetical protein
MNARLKDLMESVPSRDTDLTVVLVYNWSATKQVIMKACGGSDGSIADWTSESDLLGRASTTRPFHNTHL